MKKLLILILLVYSSTLFAQKWIWGTEGSGADANNWGDVLTDHSVATDKLGNVYLTGYIAGGKLKYGSFADSAFPNNNYWPFLIKFDQWGTPKWTMQPIPLQAASTGQISSVATDQFNNVYIAGYLVDSVSFGSHVLRGNSNQGDAFLVKLDANGNVLWARQSTDVGFPAAGVLSLAIDPSGNIYCAGSFMDTIFFGAFKLSSPNNNYAAFLTKYDANGNALWAKQSTGAGALNAAISANTDFKGHIYITGNFQDTIHFGSATLTESSGNPGNLFVVKYDTAGNVIWANKAVQLFNGRIIPYSIAVDASGGAYITGDATGSVLFGNDTITTSNTVTNSAFLCKFTSNGIPKWIKLSKDLLDTNNWIGYSVACDTLKRGGGYVDISGTSDFALPGSGKFHKKIAFCSDTFNLGYIDSTANIILQFDSNGNTTCSSIFSDDVDDDGDGICTDHAGSYVYLGGDLMGPAKFGNTLLSIYDDPFVARWQPCGVICSVRPGIAGINSICIGQSTTLTASGGTDYLWSNGATTDTVTVVPSQTTKYKVIVSTDSLCTATDSITVNVNPLQGATACCDSSIIPGQSVQLTASGGSVYIWNPPTGLSCSICPDPLATPSHTTTYTLTITSDSGCTSQQTITIDVSCGSVFVPNAFSPNKDGQNDVLYVKGYCITSMDFAIYDRWGNKVFHTTNPNEGWDGLYAGKPENAGTFAYYLKANMLDGTVVDKKGNISLVR